ncbi:MAG: F0F1 ATP synthase subunit delta [Caulobacteraceae bacterium]
MADDSQASDVAARYAQALFDLAVEKDAVAAIEADLSALGSMIRESDDLRRLIASPQYDARAKAEGLRAVAARAGLAPMVRDFLGVVASGRRAAALQRIFAAFRALAAERSGRILAEVTTASPMSAAQARALAAALAGALGKHAEIESRVEPSLLGGLKVKVGSRLYDASLKSKLDSLKLAMKRA